MPDFIIANQAAADAVPDGWGIVRRLSNGTPEYVSESNPAMPGDKIVSVLLDAETVEWLIAAGQAPWWPEVLSTPIPVFADGDLVTVTWPSRGNADPALVEHGKVLGRTTDGYIIGVWKETPGETVTVAPVDPDKPVAPFDSVSERVPGPFLTPWVPGQ